MPRGWWLLLGLAACGPAHPAPARAGADEREARADCTTKATFVETADSALEGVIVDCMTGEPVPDVQLFATGVAGTARQGDTISNASGRYRLELPEGRYQVLTVLDHVDVVDLDIEIRAQHSTVQNIRLDLPRCPPARGGPAEAPRADSDSLIAAVLDHWEAGGIDFAPPRSDPGPIYVAMKDPSTLGLPPSYARQYVVTTVDELQGEATRSGQDIRFIHIYGFEIAGSCATVTVGGDFVMAPQKGVIKMCCCEETELFLRRGDRWAFRSSRVGACI